MTKMLLSGTKGRQSMEMQKHKIVLDIAITMDWECLKIWNQPCIGTESLQNKGMLWHNIIWELVIMKGMEFCWMK